MATLALLFSAPYGIQHANETSPDWKQTPKPRAEILKIIAELFPGLNEFENDAIYSDNSGAENLFEKSNNEKVALKIE